MPRYSPFQRAQRRAARWSLYLSAALCGLVVFALTRTFDERFERPDELSDTRENWEAIEEVRLLQDYVRIDTSAREIDGARFLAARLEDAGLRPVIEELGDGRANLWAILEGERPEAIVLHNHMDVFAVDDLSGWTESPFSGTIDPPFLYGRGSFDMKSLAIAQLQAMRALAAAPARPARSVVFLATADEEGSSRLGTRWVLREHPDLAARFDLVLTEGGVVEPLRLADIKYWGIEVAQKRFAEGEACADDRARLQQLHDELMGRQWRTSLPRVTPEVERFLRIYVPTRQDDYIRAVLGAILRGRFDPRIFRQMPPYMRSPLLDEIVPFPVKEQPDGSYRMRLVAHLLPGADFEDVMQRLLPSSLTHGIDVVMEPPVGADFGSPTDSEDYLFLEAALREAHPNTPVGPYFLSWNATDARYFRQLGVPAYGFSPFLLFSSESFRADRLNERINLPGYVAGVALYVDTVRQLAARAPVTASD
jgi:acetylornithine deacetylase/succinyl-diaminopimelate desuccinylase-like protein